MIKARACSCNLKGYKNYPLLIALQKTMISDSKLPPHLYRSLMQFWRALVQKEQGPNRIMSKVDIKSELINGFIMDLVFLISPGPFLTSGFCSQLYSQDVNGTDWVCTFYTAGSDYKPGLSEAPVNDSLRFFRCNWVCAKYKLMPKPRLTCSYL